MKKVRNNLDVLSRLGPYKGKGIVDVGCGTGEFVRELTALGAKVTGIDSREMLQKAFNHEKVGDETYLEGGGERLPLTDQHADMIIYCASFHHIPGEMMVQALREANRVLKYDGMLFCLEPVGRKGSYFDILSLLEDERDIQADAYRAIQSAETIGFVSQEEYIIYFERSYDDYVDLLNVFAEDEDQKNQCLIKAKQITEQLSRESGVPFQKFRYSLGIQRS